MVLYLGKILIVSMYGIIFLAEISCSYLMASPLWFWGLHIYNIHSITVACNDLYTFRIQCWPVKVWLPWCWCQLGGGSESEGVCQGREWELGSVSGREWVRKEVRQGGSEGVRGWGGEGVSQEGRESRAIRGSHKIWVTWNWTDSQPLPWWTPSTWAVNVHISTRLLQNMPRTSHLRVLAEKRFTF